MRRWYPAAPALSRTRTRAPPAMSIVTFNNVEKSFGGQRLFATVSFAIDGHDHAVLVGRNGTGKTTLLRLISDGEHADSGTIARARGRRVWLHEQTPELERDRPVADYLLEAFGEAVELEAALRATEESLSSMAEHSPELRDTMKSYQQLQRRFEASGGYGYRSRLSGVVEGLGLPDEMLERRLLSLSGGELTRVTLARALLADADLLLLDEPTNHLDIDSVEWLEGFLAEYPRASSWSPMTAACWRRWASGCWRWSTSTWRRRAATSLPTCARAQLAST